MDLESPQGDQRAPPLRTLSTLSTLSIFERTTKEGTP